MSDVRLLFRTLHVCTSPLMRCLPLALPHQPTAHYSHQRRRHLYVCTFLFLLTAADTAPLLLTVPQKLPAQSPYPVCSVELDLRHMVYERNLRFTDTRAQGPPGPRLSPDKMSVITCPYRAWQRPLPARK